MEAPIGQVSTCPIGSQLPSSRCSPSTATSCTLHSVAHASCTPPKTTLPPLTCGGAQLPIHRRNPMCTHWPSLFSSPCHMIVPKPVAPSRSMAKGQRPNDEACTRQHAYGPTQVLRYCPPTHPAVCGVSQCTISAPVACLAVRVGQCLARAKRAII